MTKDWYLQHGFKLSPLIEQAEIESAERDVRTAYVTPIIGSATVPSEYEAVVENAVGNLAFLLMLQRSIFLTRAGAKIKTGYNSQEADAWAKLQQAAMSCHLALVELKKVPGVDASADVLDVCKIYFKSNFFSL